MDLNLKKLLKRRNLDIFAEPHMFYFIDPNVIGYVNVEMYNNYSSLF
jgi:hypothetical protein